MTISRIDMTSRKVIAVPASVARNVKYAGLSFSKVPV